MAREGQGRGGRPCVSVQLCTNGKRRHQRQPLCTPCSHGCAPISHPPPPHHTPGRRVVPRLGNLAPLVRLLAGVQRPRVSQRLLAVVAAHRHQEAVGHQRQRVRVPRRRARTRHHHPAHGVAGGRAAGGISAAALQGHLCWLAAWPQGARERCRRASRTCPCCHPSSPPLELCCIPHAAHCPSHAALPCPRFAPHLCQRGFSKSVKSSTCRSSEASPAGPMPPCTTTMLPTAAAACAARGEGGSPCGVTFSHLPLRTSMMCTSLVAPASRMPALEGPGDGGASPLACPSKAVAPPAAAGGGGSSTQVRGGSTQQANAACGLRWCCCCCRALAATGQSGHPPNRTSLAELRSPSGPAIVVSVCPHLQSSRQTMVSGGQSVAAVGATCVLGHPRHSPVLASRSHAVLTWVRGWCRLWGMPAPAAKQRGLTGVQQRGGWRRRQRAPVQWQVKRVCAQGPLGCSSLAAHAQAKEGLSPASTLIAACSTQPSAPVCSCHPPWEQGPQNRGQTAQSWASRQRMRARAPHPPFCLAAALRLLSVITAGPQDHKQSWAAAERPRCSSRLVTLGDRLR